MCGIWNTPRAPFQIFGNTYYVGTAAIGVVLITSPEGHVLIDGAIAESVPQIVDNIRTVGFRIEHVKVILNSHAHMDHAGGLSGLQRLSGAEVRAHPRSVAVLSSGIAGRDDPQAGTLPDMEPVARVSALAEGETVRVGPLALTPVFTPGHTPGGTTWTWRSCAGDECRQMVFADSLTAVSSPRFRFADSTEYPGAVADFRASIAAVAALPCDILISVHPEFSNFWSRLERRTAGEPDALIDRAACRRYADNAGKALDRRLEQERGAP